MGMESEFSEGHPLYVVKPLAKISSHVYAFQTISSSASVISTPRFYLSLNL